MSEMIAKTTHFNVWMSNSDYPENPLVEAVVPLNSAL